MKSYHQNFMSRYVHRMQTGVFESYASRLNENFATLCCRVSQDTPEINLLQYDDGSNPNNALTRFTECIGLTSEEFLAKDDKKYDAFRNKYSTFLLEDMHLNLICEQDGVVPSAVTLQKEHKKNTQMQGHNGFTYQGMQQRVLEEAQKLSPEVSERKAGDTYVELAYLHSLKLYSSPDLKLALRQYLRMVNRVKTLFDQAVTTQLTEDEMGEYNLLVTTLGVRDKHCRVLALHYSVVEKLRTLYQAEQFNSGDLLFINSFRPWRAIEFTDNKKLMERFFATIPQAGREVQDFIYDVTHFTCAFKWVREKTEDVSKTATFKAPPYGRKGYVHMKFAKTTEELLGQESILKILAQGSVPYLNNNTKSDPEKNALRLEIIESYQKMAS